LSADTHWHCLARQYPDRSLLDHCLLTMKNRKDVISLRSKRSICSRLLLLIIFSPQIVNISQWREECQYCSTTIFLYWYQKQILYHPPSDFSTVALLTISFSFGRSSLPGFRWWATPSNITLDEIRRKYVQGMKIKLVFNLNEMGVSEWKSQKPKEYVVPSAIARGVIQGVH
jgi:hypothetical protein